MAVDEIDKPVSRERTREKASPSSLDASSLDSISLSTSSSTTSPSPSSPLPNPLHPISRKPSAARRPPAHAGHSR